MLLQQSHRAMRCVRTALCSAPAAAISSSAAVHVAPVVSPIFQLAASVRFASTAAPAKASATPSTAAVEDDAAKPRGPKRPIACTVASPDAAPPVAAWRKDPNNRTEWMKDENASEAYQNLLVLAQYRFPPKPSALFRVLRHVKTKDDLAIARKAFNVCQSKGTDFDSSISRAWARACLVAGDVDAAFEKFKDPAKTRMFFTVGALEEMLDSARRDKDGALLERVLGLVHATRKAQLLSGWRMAHKLMSTYASTGKVKEALAAYARLKDQRQLTMVALPTLIVLNSIAEASEPLADAELAIVRDAVLPIARRFPVLGSRIAAVEAKLPQLTGATLSAATPAAEAAASPAAAEAAPAAAAPVASS